MQEWGVSVTRYTIKVQEPRKNGNESNGNERSGGEYYADGNAESRLLPVMAEWRDRRSVACITVVRVVMLATLACSLLAFALSNAGAPAVNYIVAFPLVAFQQERSSWTSLFPCAG